MLGVRLGVTENGSFLEEEAPIVEFNASDTPKSFEARTRPTR